MSDPNAQAIAGIADNYCIQRDPRATGGILGEIASECAKRLCEGHCLRGSSIEAEIIWLCGNNSHLTRKDLIEACVGLVETIALWREP